MRDTGWPRGIACKAGTAGVVGAEPHWDGSRNFLAQIRGHRRFILADPEEACAMDLLPRDAPSARHSPHDWSADPQKWPPGLRDARAYDVLQRPGDVLYLPQFVIHYIVNLDTNVQCNSVYGRDLRHTRRTHECLNLGPRFECSRPHPIFEVPVRLILGPRAARVEADPLVEVCAIDFGAAAAAPHDAPFFADLADTALCRRTRRVERLSILRAAARWRLGGQGGAAPISPRGFVFHQSRCGSTLVANAIAARRDSLVYSEPEILVQALERAPELLGPLLELMGSRGGRADINNRGRGGAATPRSRRGGAVTPRSLRDDGAATPTLAAAAPRPFALAAAAPRPFSLSPRRRRDPSLSPRRRRDRARARRSPYHDALFVKWPSTAVAHAGTIAAAFPGVPTAFIYRDPAAILASHLADAAPRCAADRRRPPGVGAKLRAATARLLGGDAPDGRYCAAHLARGPSGRSGSADDPRADEPSGRSGPRRPRAIRF